MYVLRTLFKKRTKVWINRVNCTQKGLKTACGYFVNNHHFYLLACEWLMNSMKDAFFLDSNALERGVCSQIYRKIIILFLQGHTFVLIVISNNFSSLVIFHLIFLRTYFYIISPPIYFISSFKITMSGETELKQLTWLSFPQKHLSSCKCWSCKVSHKPSI